MLLSINGTQLFVDTVGSSLAVDGATMQQRPSILLMHGGPGLDHSVFRPALDGLTAFAQVIVYDHRGCGRSALASPDTWHLEQWIDDAAALLKTLGITQTIVLGTSFGGFVAQGLAAKHPHLVSGLVLMSTTAKPDTAQTLAAIKAAAGETAHAAAQPFFAGDMSDEVIARYFEHCLPLYTFNDSKPDTMARILQRPQVLQHFFGREGEMHGVDLLAQLNALSQAVLILHGDSDVVFPLRMAQQMLQHLENGNAARVSLKVLPNCGHLAEQDAATAIVAAVRQFFNL